MVLNYILVGCPVYIDINRRDYFVFVREKGKTLVSFLQSWTLTLFLSNSKLSPTDRPTPKEHSWWPLTTDSRIASFDAGFHIIRRLWHLACVLVFEIEGNTFGNIFDLNDLFETQRWNWFYVQSLKSSISDRLSVRLALFGGAGEGGGDEFDYFQFPNLIKVNQTIEFDYLTYFTQDSNTICSPTPGTIRYFLFHFRWRSEQRFGQFWPRLSGLQFSFDYNSTSILL